MRLSFLSTLGSPASLPATCCKSTGARKCRVFSASCVATRPGSQPNSSANRSRPANRTLSTSGISLPGKLKSAVFQSDSIKNRRTPLPGSASSSPRTSWLAFFLIRLVHALKEKYTRTLSSLATVAVSPPLAFFFILLPSTRRMICSADSRLPEKECIQIVGGNCCAPISLIKSSIAPSALTQCTDTGRPNSAASSSWYRKTKCCRPSSKDLR
mmetsp:Transcript_66025/g.97776  ORF Transcript_66025/g.97776 Transcript_66025/m.97776 type:complete len:213 (+) Transcript_66025:440-1078(+)